MKRRMLMLFTSVVLILLCSFVIGCKNNCKGNVEEEVTIQFLVDETVVLEKTVTKGYELIDGDFPSSPTKEGFHFFGWFMDSLKISSGYIINSNTTIRAKFMPKEVEPEKQDGSAEYPYLIKTAEDLVNFSDRMNHMDEETEDVNFYKAHFMLANDIDMKGMNYTPAGKELTMKIGDESKTISGFMGTFNGNGHTISNLTISITMRTNRAYYGGLFGTTDQAFISNLTLENIDYMVEAGSDDAQRSIVMGGAVGSAKLSVFENIEVTGRITTKIFANNPAFLGGIAGEWRVNSELGSYYAYAKNCYSNVETVIGEIEGEPCSLESAANGGLFGYIYNSNSAVAIINSITKGKVFGGKYVGGLVGYSASANVSILDCGSYATIYATSKEVSYAGGLVGMVSDDTIIKDCFFNGPVVRGEKSTSAYQSYAGAIVGYAVEDDYDVYYSGGLACVNTYYKTIVRNTNVVNAQGIQMEQDAHLAFAKETLKWDDEAWEELDGTLRSKGIDTTKKTYQVKLMENGNVIQTIEKNANAILGFLDNGENKNSMVFYGWEIEDGIFYRYYMPITKDIEIAATYYDVTEISGIYSGTATLYETTDAGLMVFNPDGTLQWINSSTVNGVYRYDGKHIFIEIFNNIGEVSGTLEEGNLQFKVDAGMSGVVNYNMNKVELSFFGEYFSDNGDIITFGSDGKLSFQSTNFRDGNYTNGTYVQEGNTLTVTGSYFSSTYSSMTIVDNGDLTLTVNFISSNGNVPSLENVTFRKIVNKDYKDYPFIGSYHFAYVSSTRPIHQSQYTFQFHPNGTAEYITEFSSTECQYFVFHGGRTIKVLLEGYASEFTYDEEGNFFYGLLNRGTGNAHRSIVLSPIEDGNIYGLVIRDARNVLFATKEKTYLFVDGKYMQDTVAIVPSFDEKTRITINGEAYIILYEESEYTSNRGYFLEKVGTEEGKYTYHNQNIQLDGIGNVSGDIKGTYQTYANHLIVILTETDQFIGFDYQNAKENNGEIVLIEPDQYQGIWYYDYVKDGNLNLKYYKLLIDGYGHTAFMYYKNIYGTDKFAYAYNWGGNQWVDLTETETGLACNFNEYQHCEMRFYYDYKLMYSSNFGYLKEIAMYKEGYSGPMVPPTIPSSVVGRYVGENQDGVSVVLNIRQDLNGTYLGMPFTGYYDGEDIVTFTINTILYRFYIQTSILEYNNQTIQLSLDGQIQEVIPEILCGEWRGTWEGFGTNDKTKLVIEKDGVVRFESQSFTEISYDYETMTLKGKGLNGSGEEASIIIVYNSETNTIYVTYAFTYDGEAYTITGKNLTKK